MLFFWGGGGLFVFQTVTIGIPVLKKKVIQFPGEVAVTNFGLGIIGDNMACQHTFFS